MDVGDGEDPPHTAAVDVDAGGEAVDEAEIIPPTQPEINVIPPTQDDVFAGNDDDEDEVLATEAAELSRRMQMNTDDDAMLEEAALDLSAREKQLELARKKASKKERQRSAREENKRLQAEKHRLSVSADSDREQKKRNKQAVSLVNTPLGEARDGRRGSSGDLNPIPRVTPEDRRRLLGEGTSKGTYNANANKITKPTKEVRVPAKV